MGQTGDTDQVRQRLGFCIFYHLDNEVRSKLRDPQTAQLTSVDILRV